VNEDERLQTRINQLLDRVEASLKQALRFAAQQGEIGAEADEAAYANLLLDLVLGRWQQFAKSGFKKDPMQLWPEHWKIVLATI
jgi:TetR/AcrR family transcriptional regulator